MPDLANKFLRLIRSGEINVLKLAEMSSAERRAVFTKYLGEMNAKEVNALFEKKLLLKNQQQAMIGFIKETAGLKEQVKRDFITRVQNMKEILTDQTARTFKEDLVEKRLKIDITPEDAQMISEAVDRVSEKEKIMNASKRRKFGEKSTPEELSFGIERIKFGNLINALKEKSSTQSIVESLKSDPFNFITSELPGSFKSLKSTLDNSALFRQGLKVLTTRPSVWLKNAILSFKDIFDTFGGKEVMDMINAEVASHPLYKEMLTDKVAIGVIEEAFPKGEVIKFLEDFPLLGKLHKASNNAFAGFALRNRVDLYELYTKIAQEAGETKTTGLGIGQLVNSLTGRGSLGKFEAGADVVNNIFFSPRFLKSQIDYLTGHNVRMPGEKPVSAFVKKQAAINLLKTVGAIGTVLVIADTVAPGSVESDPRSSDFGKIKIGNTRFDVAGGMSSLLTLGARIATAETKSATTHKVRSLTSGEFGSQDRLDVIYQFMENKLSPTASVLKDILKGTDYSGKKLSVGGELINLAAPMPITNYMEVLNDPRAADTLLVLIADGLGIGTNTYGKK